MTIRRTLIILLALAPAFVAGCAPKDQGPESFEAGLEEVAKAADRGKEVREGKGVPPVPDPEQ